MTRIAEVRTYSGGKLNVPVRGFDTGRQFLDTVCRAIPVREFWFFGLQYFDKKDRPRFLSTSKLVRSCPAGRYGQPFSFRFRAIYYPPNLRDLNEVVTVELFYNEVKEQILNEYITCSKALYLSLAALAVQADLAGKIPDNYQVIFKNKYMNEYTWNGIHGTHSTHSLRNHGILRISKCQTSK